jgi:AcrR family transcriptional regulator
MAQDGTPPASRRARYHHGDLRQALLRAAEAELAEKGIEGFSLRGVAKRAGVSHAAPAHHFADSAGLLTALTAEGFGRFVAAQRQRQRKAGQDGRAQLVAAGQGYIDFAMAHPDLFRLMFSSDRPDHGEPQLAATAAAAYDKLVADVGRAQGRGPDTADVVRAWALVHGIADLLNAGRLKPLLSIPAGRERDAAVAEILRRGLA